MRSIPSTSRGMLSHRLDHVFKLLLFQRERWLRLIVLLNFKPFMSINSLFIRLPSTDTPIPLQYVWNQEWIPVETKLVLTSNRRSQDSLHFVNWINDWMTQFQIFTWFLHHVGCTRTFFRPVGQSCGPVMRFRRKVLVASHYHFFCRCC